MAGIRKNIDSLIEGFYQMGIRQWIVSPGSRNAPIVASIIKQGGFKLISHPDERSAAFLGLGANIAETPTGIICTSGTALLNYYPAICEAFYAQVPLIVLSADRPKDLIDQWDGQTIRQKDVFAQHIKASHALSGNMHQGDTLKEIKTLLNKVHADLNSNDKGPIHVNIPLADPIYEDIESKWQGDSISFDQALETEPLIPELTIPMDSNIVLFIGELKPSESKTLTLNELSAHFPILAEPTSNSIINNLKGWELNTQALNQLPVPTILITMGKNFVNKRFKQFIQLNANITHYHLHTNWYVGNPFKTDIQTIKFNNYGEIYKCLAKHKNQKTFNRAWISTLQCDAKKIYKSQKLSVELRAIQSVYSSHFDALHIGNSTPIRLAGLLPKSTATLFCNRGTSGIDGCVSTAVGYALSKPNENVACVVGDLSFLYDSNAFWCNPKPLNLQVIVLNNGGGNIFNLIDGPKRMPEIAQFIQTPHLLSCKNLAKQHGLSYSCNESHIGSRKQIIEIFSSGNEALWRFLK
jgi:2-succinyl-5-enolpyruvyl-6-hydroxy-3-cyclohexene-1-carboxylate synthase